MPSLILQCLSDNTWKSPSVPFFNTTLPVKGEEECRGGSLDWSQLKNRIRFNWKYLSSGYVFFCFHCSLGRGRDGHRSDFLPTSTGMWGATTPPSETDLSMKNIWGFFVQNWHNVLKLFPPFCNRIGNGRCVAQFGRAPRWLIPRSSQSYKENGTSTPWEILPRPLHPVFASSPTSHPPLQNSDNYGGAIYWPSATVIRKCPVVSLTNVHFCCEGWSRALEFSADE